jgi:adenylate cyclase
MSLSEHETTHQPTTAPETAPEIFEIVGRFSGRGEPIIDGDVARWLLEQGRLIRGDAEFFDELCWRLVGIGVPLWRASISVRTLHPQFLGLAFRWWRNRRLTEVVRIRHGARETVDYLESPIRIVMEEGKSVRFRLDDEAAVVRYPLLAELRAAGGTDYFACPVTLFSGRHQATSWTSDSPGGFSTGCFSSLTAILPALGAVIEARAMRRLTATLLNVYLGRTAGQRVLDGVIQRAQGEKLHAVILASDMRGFTTLSDRLPPDELIALLDDYFDAITAPVEAHGGEVLKFMGDGLLAIFPIDGSARTAVGAALTAATDGLERIARINQRRAETGRAMFRIGIGLHLGEVVFGNVGAVDRLDFTVIGPAVNLAARLESLTKRLGRSLVVSSEFAATCDIPLVSLGFHPVRGISEPEEVFGLPDGGEP